MELGSRIAQLRQKAKLTQKQLADELGISAQSVSKWENRVAAPDISLLPRIAEVFGVSIDDLFDLTVDQRLNRIENRLDIDKDFPPETFKAYDEYLSSLLPDKEHHDRVTGLLGQLYGRRMLCDAQKVGKYAMEAIRANPGKKDCQWLLSRFNGHACWDWNMSNHGHAIEFYRGIVETSPSCGLPYLYLIDNLLADNRADEAERYVDIYVSLDAHNVLMADVYRVYIVWIRRGGDAADEAMESLKAKYADDSGYLFEAAQYYAKRARYDKTIELYEASWATDTRRPRFIDALMAIADVYSVLGDYRKAAETYDRIIACQKEEWGMDDEFELQDSIRRRQELLAKVAK